VKSSVKSIVASVTEGKRVAFIAHENLELREVVVSLFSSMLPSNRVLYMVHWVSEWIMILISLNSITLLIRGIFIS
jgi:hypothetical protein